MIVGIDCENFQSLIKKSSYNGPARIAYDGFIPPLQCACRILRLPLLALTNFDAVKQFEKVLRTCSAEEILELKSRLSAGTTSLSVISLVSMATLLC